MEYVPVMNTFIHIIWKHKIKVKSILNQLGEKLYVIDKNYNEKNNYWEYNKRKKNNEHSLNSD